MLPGDVEASFPNIERAVAEIIAAGSVPLTFGGHTTKMPYGHRGGNQPVKDLATGKVLITAQNHGFDQEVSQQVEYQMRLFFLCQFVQNQEYLCLLMLAESLVLELGLGW